jgi:hypothetical protein
MKRKPRLYVEYMEVLIFRNTTPGHRLRWSCTGYAADTLEGMKALIRAAKRGALD